jgi:hypothetical protein
VQVGDSGPDQVAAGAVGRGTHVPTRWTAECGTPLLATASPRACRASMAPATLTAGLVILVCTGDLPPVSSPARAGEFRVYGFREPAIAHTGPGASLP